MMHLGLSQLVHCLCFVPEGVQDVFVRLGPACILMPHCRCRPDAGCNAADAALGFDLLGWHVLLEQSGSKYVEIISGVAIL
jgi:hypothetical protein